MDVPPGHFADYVLNGFHFLGAAADFSIRCMQNTIIRECALEYKDVEPENVAV